MNYISHHGRSFGTQEEFKFRFEQWMATDKFVKEVNAANSGYTHKAAHNKFSDRTREEYTKLLSSKNVRGEEENANEAVVEDVVNNTTAVDWRELGCVSPVKD